MTLTVINQCCLELLSVWFSQLHLLDAEHSFSEGGDGLCSRKLASHREKHVTRDPENNSQQVEETVCEQVSALSKLDQANEQILSSLYA